MIMADPVAGAMIPPVTIMADPGAARTTDDRVALPG
jgi:hypothetical protein